MKATRSVTLATRDGKDRRARTTQQILDATRDLLAGGEPLARLSINRIVAAAGVSRATFYLHFRTKRDLMAALAGEETQQWTAIVESFLGNPKADRSVLERAVAEAAEAWRTHRAVLSGFIELAEYDKDTRCAWKETVHTIGQSIATAIQQRRPTLSAAEAQQLGRLIAWAGERILHQEAESTPRESDRLLNWSLTEMIWAVMNNAS